MEGLGGRNIGAGAFGLSDPSPGRMVGPGAARLPSPPAPVHNAATPRHTAPVRSRISPFPCSRTSQARPSSPIARASLRMACSRVPKWRNRIGSAGPRLHADPLRPQTILAVWLAGDQQVCLGLEQGAVLIGAAGDSSIAKRSTSVPARSDCPNRAPAALSARARPGTVTLLSPGRTTIPLQVRGLRSRASDGSSREAEQVLVRHPRRCLFIRRGDRATGSVFGRADRPSVMADP